MNAQDLDARRKRLIQDRLSGLEHSLAEAQEVAQAAERQIQNITREKDELEGILSFLEATGEGLNGDERLPPGKSKGPPQSVVEAIFSAYADSNPPRGRSVDEIAKEVLKSGYETDLDLRRMRRRVNGELWRLSQGDAPKFKKVTRGQYRMIS